MEKEMKVTALDLKNTLARPRIYYGEYLKKHSTASPGNPEDVTKPSLNLLLVQQD